MSTAHQLPAAPSPAAGRNSEEAVRKGSQAVSSGPTPAAGYDANQRASEQKEPHGGGSAAGGSAAAPRSQVSAPASPTVPLGEAGPHSFDADAVGAPASEVQESPTSMSAITEDADSEFEDGATLYDKYLRLQAEVTAQTQRGDRLAERAHAAEAEVERLKAAFPTVEIIQHGDRTTCRVEKDGHMLFIGRTTEDDLVDLWQDAHINSQGES